MIDVQEESPLPVGPLADLATDYQHAVLHIAWDWNRQEDVVTLVFAFVELLPAEIPPPTDDYACKDPAFSKQLDRGEHRVFVRHAVLSATDAVAWYLACRAGTAVLPDDDGSLRPPSDAGEQRLVLPVRLGEEPQWPTLLSAPDDSDMLPFAPHWMHCPRSHHLVPTSEGGLDPLWSREERAEALDWLAGRLHFDLGEYPEYWGSAHLLAPNPIYREMRSRLSRRDPLPESVLIRFQPRMGASLDTLTLLYRERDVHGVLGGAAAPVRSNILRFNSTSRVQSVAEDVFDVGEHDDPQQCEQPARSRG